MTVRCLILLHDGYPGVALGYLTDAFAVANWLLGQVAYRITLASVGSSHDVPALSFGGFGPAVRPLNSVAAEDWDQVFVLVSFDPQTPAYNANVAAFLRRVVRQGGAVCGVETGAAVLAAAGLLDGGQAAVHWANRDGFMEAFPLVDLVPGRIARFRRCITCIGGAAVLDVALSLIAEGQGDGLARQVAKHLNHDLREYQRRGQPEPLAPPLAEPLARALSLMRDTLEDPVPCDVLAARCGVSLRKLERLFQNQIGHGPKAYYLAMRLTRAQNLLQQTTLGVGEVATSAGFVSFAHFTRTYRAQFGLPPSRDREQKLTSSVPRVFIHPSHLEGDGNSGSVG